tara:strand:+ start:772 stop:1317 length:546 start_codon:yes stop_codon:yes gene_type:complete
MGKLKTVNIKGKEYVEVNERLIYFRKTYPKFSLTSEVLEKTDKSILILASIINEDGRVIATGMAEEEKGSTFINKTSYVENCETSAWGRALGNFGIGIDTSVASANEVENAIANQSKPSPKKSTIKTQQKKIVLDIGDENWYNVLSYIAKNKALGLAKIIPQLETKYSIKASVKKELAKLS